MALSSPGGAVVGMVWAQTPGGVIAADGDEPWDVPEDFQHFRDTVAGRPVVVGRRTWESMPKPWRRRRAARSVVVTRDPEWAPEVDDDVLAPARSPRRSSWPRPASHPPTRSGSWAEVRSTRWGSPWRTCSS